MKYKKRFENRFSLWSKDFLKKYPATYTHFYVDRPQAYAINAQGSENAKLENSAKLKMIKELVIKEIELVEKRYKKQS